MGNDCNISKVDVRQSWTGTGLSGLDNIGYNLKDVQDATEPGDSFIQQDPQSGDFSP
jgi:hypothetical protein